MSSAGARDAQIQEWMRELAKRKHYIEIATARTLDIAWLKRFPVVLEGPPGGGKTTLVELVAEIKGATLFHLQCEKSVGKGEVLYSWNSRLQDISIAQAAKTGNALTTKEVKQIIYDEKMRVNGALMDALLETYKTDSNGLPRPVVVLIDEIDKASEDLRDMLLQCLASFEITINETNEFIRGNPNNKPLVFMTSNAGKHGRLKRLERWIRRRGLYEYLPEATPLNQYLILRGRCPNLKPSVIFDCVHFANRTSELAVMYEPFALSEVIMWVEWLEALEIKKLTASSITETITALAKSDEDKRRLLGEVDGILDDVEHYRREFYQQHSFSKLQSKEFHKKFYQLEEGAISNVA